MMGICRVSAPVCHQPEAFSFVRPVYPICLKFILPSARAGPPNSGIIEARSPEFGVNFLRDRRCPALDGKTWQQIGGEERLLARFSDLLVYKSFPANIIEIYRPTTNCKRLSPTKLSKCAH